MNEPVSMLDIMVYKAQLKAERHLPKVDFDSITLREVPFNYADFKKSVENKYGKLAIPITWPNLDAEFLFDKRKFQFHLSGIWYLAEFDYDLNKPTINKHLKNTMDNISNSCAALLRNISFLSFSAVYHAGYSTKSTREMPKHEELVGLIESDTTYKVTLVLGNEGGWESDTSISCETDKNILAVKEKNLKDIKFNYIGKWSNLIELEKEALKELEW